MQKLNLCKRSQVITRYASIGLSLTLSNLKFFEAHYLSDFDLSSGTKLFYILQNSICFQKFLVRHLNSKKELEFSFYGYIILLRTKLMFNSFVSFILFLLANALIQTVAIQVLEECLLEPLL